MAQRVGRRTLIEFLHLVGGVIATLVIASAAAWAVPSAFYSIWVVAGVAILVTIVIAIRPLRAACAQDQARDGDGNG